MKNGLAVFGSYLTKGDKCVLQLFELKFMLITNLTHLFNVFISLLYMFRAIQCSSSGESIVSIHHLLYITLCRWPSGMQASDLNIKRPPTEMHGQQNKKFVELKSGEKESATETCWRIYVSGLVCIPLCSNICCYERILHTTVLV
jgi:hypothetical protein